MRKSIILTLVVFMTATGIINEARAQALVFEIPIEKDKIANLSSGNIETQKKEEVASKPEEKPAEPQVDKTQEFELARIQNDKQKLIENGFKADYYEIYRQAAERYGLEWQYLAAVHKIESGQNGDTARKSGAGATGPMQFIPSTFRAYAVDGDGDGAKNINNVYDAIFTAANYLATNKQEKDMTFALFRYNHSTSYVNKVKGMAASLR